MKRGKAPTARQKRWHDAVAQLPCVSCGATPVHIHHCVGSTTKHNKVHIGQDWVIPLCYDCHQGPGGVHGDMSAINTQPDIPPFSRKEFEKAAFDLIRRTSDMGGHFHLTPERDVVDAIMGYHK